MALCVKRNMNKHHIEFQLGEAIEQLQETLSSFKNNEISEVQFELVLSFWFDMY